MMLHDDGGDQAAKYKCGRKFFLGWSQFGEGMPYHAKGAVRPGSIFAFIHDRAEKTHGY
jgi:hypothetical protein